VRQYPFPVCALSVTLGVTAVRRAFTSSLLSILLLATLVWGGCISCDEYFMWPGAKSCCAPDGHCKTKSPPSRQDPGRQCKQIDFDHQKSVDHHVDLAVVTAAVQLGLPVRTVEAFARWQGLTPMEPSPPDFQVLHSTFLI
jgi:hypothetical protein